MVATGSYLFLILWLLQKDIYSTCVTRRFDTTLDKFGNLDTNLSVGLLSKHLVGNPVDNKAF